MILYRERVCRNVVKTLSSLSALCSFFWFHLRTLSARLFGAPRHRTRCRALFVCLLFHGECSASFLNLPACWNTWGLLSHLLLFSAWFPLLRYPSCETAPGINTRFQVWSPAFPAAARQELISKFKTAQLEPWLVFSSAAASSGPSTWSSNRNPPAYAQSQSPFASARCPLHTLASICLLRLQAF